MAKKQGVRKSPGSPQIKKSPGTSRKRASGTSSASPKKKGAQASSSSSAMSYYAQLARQAETRPNVITSGSSPAVSLKVTMATMAVLQDLHEGIPVTKISHGGDWHRRILTLSQDQCALFITHARVNNETHVSKLPRPIWTPSKGWYASYQRYVDIADVTDVTIGVVGTQVLESALNSTITNNKKKNNKTSNKDLMESIVTIHHHEYLGRRTLNLLIDNPNHRMALIGALATMRQYYQDQEQWVGREILLMRYIWYDIDTDKNAMVNEREFGKICDRINLSVDGGVHRRFREFLKENKIRGGREITYGECTKLLAIVKGKNAIDEIWKRLFGSTVSVTAKKLQERFLIAAQGEKHATLQDAEHLIATLNTMELGEGSEPQNKHKLEKDRFEEYLRSEWNDAYDPTSQAWPTMGLTKPLSAYWINSSHNTYLTGDQLTSKSSVEAYTGALQRGCKCLELDVWDRTTDNNARRGAGSDPSNRMPVIFHGHTMTSKIDLESVLLVVNNYLAKHPNTYPIILSIENHCSIPYQEAMARLIKRIFGVRLFIPTSSQRTVQMPSPEELKGMIVIKGKRPPEPDDAKDDDPNGAGGKRDTEDFMAEMFDKVEQSTAATTSHDPTIPRSYKVSSSSNGKGGRKNGKKGGDSKAKSEGDDDQPAFSKELLEITYFHGTKFKYFEESISMMPSHMHSINETKIVKLVTHYDNNPDLWREYNAAHLTRTYPAGTRVDSSNYSPMLAWAMGCQLVALNFQTPGPPMILNDGRFRQNGSCGYVEKPESVMVAGKKALPRTVKIRMISGSCLPKPNGDRMGETIDPFVRIELHDIRTTKRGKEQYYCDKHVTKKVGDNGFSPSFTDKGHSFEVQNPDVAMLVFRLIDQDVGINDEIASAAIPVSCLRKGFRSIQLYHQSNSRPGPFHYSTLLAHIIP